MEHVRVWFRMFQMPCCGHLLCWVNPRLPAYCPECGKLILMEIKKIKPQIEDADAELNFVEG